MRKSKNSCGPSASSAIRMARNQKDAGVRPFTLSTLVLPVAFTSSSGASGNWYWQYRLNSLFDPDFTGGSSQPTTFDQWMTLYARYRVLAVTVDFTVTETANATSIALVAAPSIAAPTSLTYMGVGGMRDAVYGNSATYTSEKRLRRTYAIKDVFGIDQEAMMSEINYAGTSSTSAPAVAYLTMGVFCSSGAAFSVCVHGSIRFAVRFEEPVTTLISLSKAALAAVPQEPAAVGRLLVSTSTAREIHDISCTCPRCVAAAREFIVPPVSK